MNNTPSTSPAETEMEGTEVPEKNAEAIAVLEEAAARAEQELQALADQEEVVMAQVARDVEEILAEVEMEDSPHQLAA